MALVKNTQEITNSTIGPNSFFTGRFHINGSLKIDGKFEGKSLQAEQLYVGATGKLKTDIIANSIIVRSHYWQYYGQKQGNAITDGKNIW